MTSFGEKIRTLRADSGISLREFCVKMGVDPGNWSRIERDLANPPTDQKFFNKLQKILKFSEKTKIELVAQAKTTVITPKEFKESGLMEHLPVMLRKANGDELKADEIESLIKWIRGTVKKEHGS